jgi:adenylosuccinate lyase
MKSDIDFSTYQSPFSWRYGTDEMRVIFSEVNKRKTWRQVWVALAKAQNKAGLVNKKELEDIVKNKDKVDISKAHEIEKEIKHDLMAELKIYTSQAKIGGGKIHLGATSQDIEDNADIINLTKAVNLVESRLKKVLLAFAKKIDASKDLVCMAYTHLQPAEPTTMGYRFSVYAQELLIDLDLIRDLRKYVKGKGVKGAVGNYASYFSLVGTKVKKLEEDVLKDLGIEAFEVSNQVYPRKIEYLTLVVLASIAQSLYKFAFDLRVMQSQGFGELMEPFGAKQVGSSAMPFKRNPITSEKICSLARYVVSQTRSAWDNASHSLLERTLDDSASRRLIIPSGFLAVDEILTESERVVSEIIINNSNIEKNLNVYGPFSSLEAIMLAASKKGGNRQELHEILREHSLVAWAIVESSGKNPLFENLKNDKRITKYLTADELGRLFDFKKHIGLASSKSVRISEKVKAACSRAQRAAL